MSIPTLYTCLIDEQTEHEAFVQVYWSRADDIGSAIEKMLSAARANGLTSPEPREIDPYDIDSLEGDVEPNLDAETFWATGRVFFNPEPFFRLPYGIIGSCIEGEYDINEITSGFTRSKSDDGKTTIEVNVPREALFEIYSLLLKINPLYKVFWYLLHDHWEDMQDHFLVNEFLNRPDAILNHLRKNELDSLMNGYVTLTAYLEEGATNLNISDHKRIIISTYSDELANVYSSALNNAGYPQIDELVSIDDQIHHWHYRHPNSRSRRELVENLHSIGFSDWTPKRKNEQSSGDNT